MPEPFLPQGPPSFTNNDPPPLPTLSPRSDTEAAPSAGASITAPIRAKRVLIVEDDVTSRNALRALLKGHGYEVSAVGTVADALAALDSSVDAIVLDLMLPDGDGTDVLRAIRSAGLGARVCVTTGVMSPVWLSRVKDLNPGCILRKPIDLNELLKRL